MSPLAHAVTTALFAFVWQGAAVGVCLSIVLALLSRRSANLRYLACAAAMAILAALPVVTAWLAYSHPASFAEALPGLAPAFGAGLFAALQPWAIPVWTIGVAMSSLRLLAGWWHVSRLRASVMRVSKETMNALVAIERRLELAGRARVAIAALAEGPVVVGFWRPMILLPLSAAIELTREQLEAVLAHEAAHIRRYDYAVNVAQVVIETLLFYHPVTWWVSARMRREREQCCDEAAVAMSGDPVIYARGLLTLERLRLSAPTLALGATGDGGALSARIARLLGRGSTTSVWPATAIALVAFILLACGGSLVDPPKDEAPSSTQALQQVIFDNPAAAVAGTLELREDSPVVGRRLARIQSDQPGTLRQVNLSLPVRLGDTIMPDTRGRVDVVLKQVAPDYKANFIAIPDHKAALILTRDSMK
jgi:beta-lactamase regulating signal transducer with metallopeptidase domain